MNEKQLVLHLILKQLENGPTILSLARILEVKSLLQLLQQEALLKEEEDFLNIMDILANAFLASAIFEVNDQNKPQLENFSLWLSELGKRHRFGKHEDDLSAYAHVLLQTFSD